MAKILIVEDDPLIANSLSEWLEMEGHKPQVAYDGLDGLQLLQTSGFDLAIVDWQLPGIPGTELCRRYRQSGGRIPIMMLTQRANVIDKETGLDAGADDYVAKPFSIRELGARVRALLRRSTGLFEGKATKGELSLDYSGCTVTVRGRKVKLLPREFELLEFLLRHPNTYFNGEKLIDHVWQSDTAVSNEALRTCVSRLRSKLDEPGAPSVIETSKGWGYKISDEYLQHVARSTETE
ncbi:MAG: response regulator transcription factor [Candidatus Obscuribacterales bacterium]|nr:response regulator transcription factor [Candidatus Obscuribacterales bacterium]